MRGGANNDAERRDALRRWDSEIISEYLARATSGVPDPLSACKITLQRSYARQLVMVVADLSVRSSDELGTELANMDSTMMRDIVVGAGIGRYVSALPTSAQSEEHPIADHIVSGLIVRRDPETRLTLLRLTVDLPRRTRHQLDSEINRVLRETDPTDLDDWHGDLVADLRSSVIEAIIGEWMHMRAEAFGIADGPDSSRHLRPVRTHQRSPGAQ
jgi:hypothetical protein